MYNQEIKSQGGGEEGKISKKARLITGFNRN
jgi:hypothetical protein